MLGSALVSDNFRVGDKVVYPNHGIGVIEQISSRTIGENVQKFYLLSIKSSSVKITVPVENVGAVGMRRVVKNGDIEKIVEFLAHGEVEGQADWKNRFKENSDRMRTGSLLDVAFVLKGLLVLDHVKPVSAREKKMMERARYLLVSELAMAKDCAEQEVEALLTAALAKSKLKFPDASYFIEDS